MKALEDSLSRRQLFASTPSIDDELIYLPGDVSAFPYSVIRTPILRKDLGHGGDIEAWQGRFLRWYEVAIPALYDRLGIARPPDMII
jgi:hypothetical protein